MVEMEERKMTTTTTFRDVAVRKMARLILIYTFLPLAAIAWSTTKSWSLVALSIAIVPCWAMLQSAVGLLTYRLYYANSPTPLTPRHGVVVVNPVDKRLPKPLDDATNQNRDESRALGDGHADDDDNDAFYEIPYEQTTLNPNVESLNRRALHERPLRLLIIGDSLAIGVGQNHWPTPLLPETLAKTLSKKMGGRVVYWTCHGATGASIGWVIRELERGVEYLQKQGSEDAAGDAAELSSCSDTDESSSDDDSFADEEERSPRRRVSDGLVKGEEEMALTAQWRRRLRAHRQRFEPNLQGFYDIAVVFTGPNDLKTAILPFLATGGDSEFRRQAQARGSSFGSDLRLLLDTLSRKMKQRLQSLFGDSMEEAVDLLVPGGGTAKASLRSQQGHLVNRTASTTTIDNRNASSNNDLDTAEPLLGADERLGGGGERLQCPLVVLPGMPARALPIFQHEPIRWYAPAAVDIMDMHKRDVACALPQDILYVPAPTNQDITDYLLQRGPDHALRQTEDAWLSLRDMPRHDSAWHQQRMREYYRTKGRSAYLNNPFKALRRRLLGVPPPVHLKAFAVDGIHPNELGYDFWGRYLGRHIFEEWQKRHGDPLA